MDRSEDTSREATVRAMGALLEFYDRFPALREKSVLGGGIAVAHWVGVRPDFGVQNTADVDMVLDLMIEESHPTLRRELLATQDYVQKKTGGKRYANWRKGATPQHDVEFDFQAPVHGGRRPAMTRRGRGDVLQEIADLSARVLEGGDLALRQWTEVVVKGISPSEKPITGKVRMVKPFVIVPLKAIAFQNRGVSAIEEKYRRLKDAGDLYALFRFLDPEELAREAAAYRHLEVMKEGVDALRRLFLDVDGEGAAAAVGFYRDRFDSEQVSRLVVDATEDFLEAYDRTRGP